MTLTPAKRAANRVARAKADGRAGRRAPVGSARALVERAALELAETNAMQHPAMAMPIIEDVEPMPMIEDVEPIQILQHVEDVDNAPVVPPLDPLDITTHPDWARALLIAPWLLPAAPPALAAPAVAAPAVPAVEPAAAPPSDSSYSSYSDSDCDL